MRLGMGIAEDRLGTGRELTLDPIDGDLLDKINERRLGRIDPNSSPSPGAEAAAGSFAAPLEPRGAITANAAQAAARIALFRNACMEFLRPNSRTSVASLVPGNLTVSGRRCTSRDS